MRLIVITGLSGSGKSTVLSALADVGAYCVDNLPVPLLQALVDVVGNAHADRDVAVGIDAREPRYLNDFAAAHAELVAAGHDIDIVFLEAAPDVLVRRYSETRRKHPLGDLPAAITEEQQLVAPLKAMATRVIDTGGMRSRALRQLVRDRYGKAGVMNLVLSSFGFKNGLLKTADLVFDARYLTNPYYIPELRPLTGLDAPVRDYVLGQPDAGALLEQIERLVRFQLPRSARAGCSYLTVAIGCTGGQHRSVALTEALAARLQAGEPISSPPPHLSVRHRDVEQARQAVQRAMERAARAT